MIVDGIYSDLQLPELSCASILQIRYATNYASVSTSACVIAVHMLHTKPHFGNCSHFSEREENTLQKFSPGGDGGSGRRPLPPDHLTFW